MVARLVWDQKVVGSSPATPTERKRNLPLFYFIFVPMKIKFVDEYTEREAEIVGRVLCTWSSFKTDLDDEFKMCTEYNIYREADGSHVVFNERSGWYAGVPDDFERLRSWDHSHFGFKLLTPTTGELIKKNLEKYKKTWEDLV